MASQKPPVSKIEPDVWGSWEALGSEGKEKSVTLSLLVENSFHLPPGALPFLVEA